MPVTLAQYHEMVDALLDAYNTGTPDAMRRHWRLTWHQRSWDGMRTYVQADLGKVPGPDVEITVDDARWLVAREHGFESWRQLVDFAESGAVERTDTVKPVGVTTRAHPSGNRAGASRNWHTIIDQLRAPDATGLYGNGQVTDALLQQLPPLPHITTVQLGGCSGVTDAGVQYLLERLPNLTHVDLSSTSISDRSCDLLAPLPALRRLVLAWTRVTDAGAAAMSRFTHIERINLLGTATGDGAIAALKDAHTLWELCTGNAVSDAGIPLLRDIPAFGSWAHTEAYAGMEEPEGPSNHLQLRGRFSPRGLARLADLSGVVSLDLDDAAMGVSGEMLAHLVELPHLSRLSFDADDAAMPWIARMRRLSHLSVQDTKASDAAWSALSASTSIERIWGRRCHGLGNRGFRALSQIPTLRALSVSCLNVDDDAVALLPSFPALRELMPMDIPDAGYRHIGACSALEALTLMYCRNTTDAATEHLLGLPQLRRYFASYTQITDRTPALLTQVHSLESVTFDSCAHLSNAGIATLAQLPRLTELRVSGAGLTAAVGDAFPPTVRVDYSL
jgi:Leucine-rich repeat (LRR) protein